MRGGKGGLTLAYWKGACSNDTLIWTWNKYQCLIYQKLVCWVWSVHTTGTGKEKLVASWPPHSYTVACCVPGWCNYELPHWRNGPVTAENHTHPWRLGVSGVHHSVRWHWHPCALHLTWGMAVFQLKTYRIWWKVDLSLDAAKESDHFHAFVLLFQAKKFELHLSNTNEEVCFFIAVINMHKMHFF